MRTRTSRNSSLRVDSWSRVQVWVRIWREVPKGPVAQIPKVPQSQFVQGTFSETETGPNTS